jgi:hypothetical protein
MYGHASQYQTVSKTYALWVTHCAHHEVQSQSLVRYSCVHVPAITTVSALAQQRIKGITYCHMSLMYLLLSDQDFVIVCEVLVDTSR